MSKVVQDPQMCGFIVGETGGMEIQEPNFGTHQEAIHYTKSASLSKVTKTSSLKAILHFRCYVSEAMPKI